MPRPLKFRPTLRQTVQANKRALDAMAAASGEPRLEMPDPLKRYMEPVAPRAEKRDLEGPIIKAVWDLLQAHPAVVLALRMNSGMAYSQTGAPVFFQRWCKPMTGMRLSDFIGVLRGHRDDEYDRPARAAIFFAIECKAPSWRGPRTEREREQDNFLLAVREAGGVAGFATSGDMAQRIVEGK